MGEAPKTHTLPSGELLSRVKGHTDQKVVMGYRKYSTWFIPGKQKFENTQTIIGSLNSALKKDGLDLLGFSFRHE